MQAARPVLRRRRESQGPFTIVRKGWAEQHPVARTGRIPPNVVMIYAPRDEEEVGVVAGLVEEAHRYAGGGGAAASNFG